MAPTAAATATATTSSDAGEGPVMGLINKRLRALRKKLNRITQMEESISQGKTLNKEQQEVLRSKPSVLILIEELDKLRTPLSAAVSEEITLATQHHEAPSDQTTAPEQKEVVDNNDKLEDLVNLLYFGSLFDVKSQNELASIMLTRTHERGCCLVYDTVTDESTDLLCDRDLDLISGLWTMMISRPADSSLSHKNALERCVEHAKLWLANSDQPIASNCDVSYAALREKLKKIMGSNYFTITPEMVVAPVEAVAAAGGNYGSFQVVGDSEQKEEDASNLKEQESAVNDQSEQPKDESVTEGEVVQGQQEQGYTQVEGGRSKRDYQQQQYVPRGSHQNQRGQRGARRGHSSARGGRGGGGGYSNGRYESYDNSGGNGYQRSYNNNRGRGRGGGGGNGHSYNNNHQDSNVTVAS